MIINVLAWREKKHWQIKKTFLKQSVISIFIGLLIVICVHFVFIHRLNAQEKENQRLTQAISSYDSIIHNAAPATRLSQTIEQQKNIIAALKNKQAQTIELFNLFQSLLPKDIYLTKINRADKLITLMGNSSRNEAFSELMQHLEFSPHFNAVHLKKISAQKFEINLMEVS
jgi:type IV pilus assembly protein PilN